MAIHKSMVLALAAATGLFLANSPSVRAQDAPATPAASAQQTMADDLTELRTQLPALMDQLNTLATQLGVEELPPVDWDRFLSDFLAAMPMLAEGDGRDWASSADFDFTTTTVTTNDAPGELEPEADGQIVLGDASGCTVDHPGAQVVHFRRIRQDDIRGHQCVIVLEPETETWVLYSRTFAEGHGRRLVAKYGVAVSAEGSGDLARALGEPKIEAQVAVASSIANYALGLMDRAPAASVPGAVE